MSAAAELQPPDRLPGLLGELLAEQRALAAVDVFARRHDESELRPALRVYEDRIPLGRTPLPGQQLAFRVDLDACTGCKACVTACHSLNGLALDETWRDVGLLLGEGADAGVQQIVTTSCHHCEDPACLAGCPVQAYDKDPVTGIVHHLDDQCIGCSYCVLKCPYDAPRYNAELGIVRKCDMCAGRLAVGEAPACVQGCPNGAIAIAIVERRAAAPVRPLLPTPSGDMPDAAHTRPTTRYVSARPVRRLRPASRNRLAPAQAHDPLAVMLVLMQLSVGTLLLEALAAGLGASQAGRAPALLLAAGTALAGLAAAALHLGRPLYAFRAFLGWRTSWMSREIVAFGAYAPAVVLAAAGGLVPLETGLAAAAGAAAPLLHTAALLCGAAGTICSVMIYVDTRRPAWSLARTAVAFGGTLAALGALGAATAIGVGAQRAGAGTPTGIDGLLAVGLLALLAKLAADPRLLRRRAQPALRRTLRLLRGPLRTRVRLRRVLAGLGALAAASALTPAAAAASDAALALTALACCALGELVERQLYFTSEATPSMPGH